jgi:integrase
MLLVIVDEEKAGMSWRNALAKAGMPDDVLIHDLRRSASKWLIDGKVERSRAKKFTGHVTDQTFEDYAIVDLDSIREDAEEAKARHDKKRNADTVRTLRSKRGGKTK